CLLMPARFPMVERFSRPPVYSLKGALRSRGYHRLNSDQDERRNVCFFHCALPAWRTKTRIACRCPAGCQSLSGLYSISTLRLTPRLRLAHHWAHVRFWLL